MILTEYLLLAGQGHHLGCRTMLHNSRWASPRLWGMILVPRPGIKSDTHGEIVGKWSGAQRPRMGEDNRDLPKEKKAKFHLLFMRDSQKERRRRSPGTNLRSRKQVRPDWPRFLVKTLGHRFRKTSTCVSDFPSSRCLPVSYNISLTRMRKNRGYWGLKLLTASQTWPAAWE